MLDGMLRIPATTAQFSSIKTRRRLDGLGRFASTSLALAFLLCAPRVLAEALPADAELEALGAVFGEIEIEVGNVFDTTNPEEDSWVYQLVNRLHLPTRVPVIRRQLLFQPGDHYSERLMRESERLLRTRRYLYDAEIRPIRIRGNRVDVVIRARDVWTLTPGLSFSRSGGSNSFEAELQDQNLFGTGMAVTLKHKSDIDRESTLVDFRDPNLLGRRLDIDVSLADTTDGSNHHFELGRPFFALDTRWSAGGRIDLFDQMERIWQDGAITRRFQHQLTQVEGAWGISRGLVDGWARRLHFGYRYEEHRFGIAGKDLDYPEEDPGPDFPFKTPPPIGRTLSYPFVELEMIEDAFVETQQVDRIHRTEDLYLGLSLRARLGWSSTAFGGDRDRGIAELAMRHGRRLGERKVWRSEAYLGGRWTSDGTENVLATTETRLDWRNWGSHLFHVRLELAAARRLDPERQLLLGGDTGLRGYPLRLQDGDRRFLLTLEQRFFTNWHPLNLARVGGAVFVDIGRAWSEGRPNEPGVLGNVGFGLRLASSRSSRGSVLHFDVAFPLGGPDDIRGVQWLVSSKETF